MHYPGQSSILPNVQGRYTNTAPLNTRIPAGTYTYRRLAPSPQIYTPTDDPIDVVAASWFSDLSSIHAEPGFATTSLDSSSNHPRHAKHNSIVERCRAAPRDIVG